MSAVDWLARTVMLVLAALATLALIGSLASVSNTPVGDALPGEIASSPQPIGDLSEAFTYEAARGEGATQPQVERRPAPADVRPLPAGQIEIARWLKALTYAVLALAAIAATGVVALVRIGSRLSPR